MLPPKSIGLHHKSDGSINILILLRKPQQLTIPSSKKFINIFLITILKEANEPSYKTLLQFICLVLAGDYLQWSHKITSYGTAE